jgi:hypothetical protein
MYPFSAGIRLVIGVFAMVSAGTSIAIPYVNKQNTVIPQYPFNFFEYVYQVLDIKLQCRFVS